MFFVSNIGWQVNDGVAGPRVTPTILPTTAQFNGVGSGSIDVSGLGLQADDLILIFFQEDDGGDFAPSGSIPNWTYLTDSHRAWGTNNAISVYWKRSDGTETSASIPDTGDHQIAMAVVLRGVDWGSGGEDWLGSDIVHNGQTASSGISVDGVTTTVENTLVIIGLAGTLATSYNSPSNANLTDLAIIDQQTTTGGDDGCVAAVAGVKATAGATGDTSINASSNQGNAHVKFAVKGLTS